jgi:FkbM family methyltransferase
MPRRFRKLKQGIACCRRFGIADGTRLWIQLRAAPSRPTRLIKLAVPALRNPIWLRCGTSDEDTFFQIFVNAEYDVSGTKQWEWLTGRYDQILSRGLTPLIIDCGANIGLSSIWFSWRFPKSDIVAVEPDASNIALMRKNLQSYPAVQIVQGGVWDKKCRLSITNIRAEPWAFRVEENENGPITAYTIEELSHGRDIFIAKIDIEGSERALFRSNDSWVSKSDMIAIEMHDWLHPGQGTSTNFLRRVARETFDILSTTQNLFFFLRH